MADVAVIWVSYGLVLGIVFGIVGLYKILVPIINKILLQKH